MPYYHTHTRPPANSARYLDRRDPSDPRGDKKTRSGPFFRCSGPSPAAVSKGKPFESSYGQFSQGKVTWDDKEDRPFMRCDMKEYKFVAPTGEVSKFMAPAEATVESRSVTPPRSQGSLVIVERLLRLNWPPAAAAGRHVDDTGQPFWLCIWVHSNNVEFVIY